MKLRVKLAGKYWTIRHLPARRLGRDVCGLCDDPKRARPEIWLKQSLSEKDMLDTTVHELLHALFPDLSEESVTKAGTEIAKVLWKLGYRKDSNGGVGST